MALDFFTLEGVFWNLTNSLAEKNHSPEPEVNQNLSEPVRELDEKEPEEEETSDFTKLERAFGDLRISLAQMRHSLEPKANQVQSEPVRELDEKAPEEDHAVLMENQEEETPSNNTFSTSEPQCNELATGTYEHPCQLPQEQCETSDYFQDRT